MSIIRKIKLHSRLILTILSVSVIPLILLTCLSFTIFKSSIQNKLIQSTHQSAQLASNNINLLFNNYRHYIDILSVSDAVQALGYIDTPAKPSLQYDVTYNLSRLFQVTPIPDSGMMGVIFLNKEKHSIFGSGFATTLNPQILNVLDQCDNTSPRDCIDQYINPNNQASYIAIARKIYSSRLSGTHVGYIIVLLSSESLYTATFASPKITEDAGFLLISSAGNVLASQHPEGFVFDNTEKELVADLMEKSVASEDLTAISVQNSYLHICYYNEAYATYMLSVIPYSFISNEQNRVISVMLTILIPLILLCLTICYFLNKSINTPIQRMIDASNIDINTSVYQSIDDNSPDELGFLARTLDKKTKSILELIENIKESDANKRNLELEILHYQINPHFLFNTLGTFKWMAELSNNTILSDGIGSLTSLLKSTLVENAEFVTLQNEVNNLKHYNRIQDLRYISRFQTSYELAEDTLSCLIPHFILQPLLENAIIHATSDMNRIINITIKSSLEGAILKVVIADDGSGFDVDSVYDNKKDRFTGVGLQNVNERLKLYYGPENGLIIASQPGSGTVCTLLIPANYDTKEST